jgi:tetratricopeptide (TPR) repeat protein
MAKKKEFDLIDNPEAAVEASLSKVEGFVQNNKEKILYVLGAVVVLIAGTWGYNQFITKPKEEKAQIAIYPAQLAFEKDSLELALNGNGLSIGFLDIIDEYGSTKAANLANYYAGLCYLNLGEPADAIGYLDNFKGSDPVLSVLAKGAIGDAFANLNQPEEASEYYLKAAEKNSNNFLTPIFLKKAGTAAEMSEDFKTALKVYKRLKSEFSNSDEAQDIDALISFCEAKMNNR